MSAVLHRMNPQFEIHLRPHQPRGCSVRSGARVKFAGWGAPCAMTSLTVPAGVGEAPPAVDPRLPMAVAAYLGRFHGLSVSTRTPICVPTSVGAPSGTLTRSVP
jgi:hypothetical protein